MTALQLKSVACTSIVNAQIFLPYINDALTRFNILTETRQLCFLAQVSHESGGLFYTEELASGTAYEGRANLGNTQPGDGPRFKGRGLIQITGRANYKLVGDALGEDFVTNPTLLGGKNINACSPNQLKYAAMSAGWFWNRANLNVFADKISLAESIDEGTNLDNFKEITRRINGGYNGLADRIGRYKKGLEALNINPH